MNFIKGLLCKHEFKFIRNVYGDEVNHLGGYRSISQCVHCGKKEYGGLIAPLKHCKKHKNCSHVDGHLCPCDEINK